MLNVMIEESGNTAILHCSGRMVRGYEETLLCAAAGQCGRDIVLDLSRIDAIDAAGVGALISLQAAGIYLQLLNPAPVVREVLRVTQLDSVFEICEEPPAANEEDLRSEQLAVRFLLPLTANAG